MHRATVSPHIPYLKVSLLSQAMTTFHTPKQQWLDECQGYLRNTVSTTDSVLELAKMGGVRLGDGHGDCGDLLEELVRDDDCMYQWPRTAGHHPG